MQHQRERGMGKSLMWAPLPPWALISSDSHDVYWLFLPQVPWNTLSSLFSVHVNRSTRPPFFQIPVKKLMLPTTKGACHRLWGSRAQSRRTMKSGVFIYSTCKYAGWEGIQEDKRDRWRRMNWRRKKITSQGKEAPQPSLKHSISVSRKKRSLNVSYRWTPERSKQPFKMQS